MDVSSNLNTLAEAVTANGSTLRDYTFTPAGMLSATGSSFNPDANVTRLDTALALQLVKAADLLLADVDRLTGQLLRGRRHSEARYERDRPGEQLHVDVKKLGRVPDGGGWRVHGRSEEVRGSSVARR